MDYFSHTKNARVLLENFGGGQELIQLRRLW